MIGQPLPRPFVAVVTDSGHNRPGDVPVTFTVTEGDGNFNGESTVAINTDSDGRAFAVLTLGPGEGFDNNVVEANFVGNIRFPAVFVASGLSKGPASETKVSGVVLDNSDIPIPNVTVEIEGTNLSTQTELLPIARGSSRPETIDRQSSHPKGRLRIMTYLTM